jgi:hypothetical protein
MLTKQFVLFVLALPMCAGQTVAHAADMPPTSNWIPQEAVLAIELRKPEALLDPILSPDTAKAVTSLPVYKNLASNPKFQQFLAILTLFEVQLGTDWRTALRALVGGGATLAVGPGGETLLGVDGQDPARLAQLHKILLGFATAEAKKQDQPDRVTSSEYRGIDTWSFGPKETHAILGNRALVANRSSVLRHVLDLRADPNKKNLASSPFYQAAQEALGGAAIGWVFADLRALKQHPPIKQALARARNPLTTLLLAGVREALDTANWAALGLYVKDDTLTVRIVSDGKAPEPTGPAGFASPRLPEEGVLPAPRISRSIARISLYRDLRKFYAAKDDLFPDRTSGLIFFENMMGIFFSGLDLTEEVLGETLPDARLVVAGQEYDPAIGTPTPQLPAFAAILHLRHPQPFGAVVEEAWQKAIGLVNFTRGQQALPGLIIDRVPHGDTKYTVAYFRPPAKPSQTELESRFNFRPALARAGDYVILSSTDRLAAELIDALAKETRNPPKPLPKIHSVVEVDGTSLQAILRANRQRLIRQNMIGKGNSQEQAEAEVGLLMTILDCLNQAKLSLGYENGSLQASLELTLRAPDVRRSVEAPTAR